MLGVRQTHRRSVIRLAAAGVMISVALSGCASSSSVTQHVWTGQLVEGGQTYATPVRNWKDLKFVNLVRQKSDFSCGAAALATIFNYAYGKSVAEEDILVEMLEVSDAALVREKGFSLLDIKRYLATTGLTGEGYNVEYDALQHLKVPGIVLLDLQGYKHFVVLRLVDGDVVHLGDPALGNRTMTRAAFEAAWNDVVFVVVGEGYDETTILRRPSPPLSASALFGMRAPLQNAEIYDFGFGPAFNFGL